MIDDWQMGFTRESHRTYMGIKENPLLLYLYSKKGSVHKFKSIYLPNICLINSKLLFSLEP